MISTKTSCGGRVNPALNQSMNAIKYPAGGDMIVSSTPDSPHFPIIGAGFGYGMINGRVADRKSAVSTSHLPILLSPPSLPTMLSLVLP